MLLYGSSSDRILPHSATSDKAKKIVAFMVAWLALLPVSFYNWNPKYENIFRKNLGKKEITDLPFLSSNPGYFFLAILKAYQPALFL